MSADPPLATVYPLPPAVFPRRPHKPHPAMSSAPAMFPCPRFSLLGKEHLTQPSCLC